MHIKSTKLLEFLSDWGGLVVFVYFIATAFFGAKYRHIHNEQYLLTAVYLGPLIAIFLSYITLYRLQFQKKALQKLALLFGAIFAWIALWFGTSGIVVILNSNFGVQSQICMSGVIQYKWHNSGLLGNSFNFDVRDSETNKTFSIDSYEMQYEKYKVGDFYEECWVKGSLGLLYSK